MYKSNRSYELYIEDILTECNNIKKFIQNITYEEFHNNIEKVYAVAKAFENIGEAVKNLPKELTNRYPHIAWSEIAKMRDILTHHYFGIDDKVLWDTLEDDFDEFKNAIDDIFSNKEKIKWQKNEQ